ncbi:MAG: hypothetical protein WCF92_00180 [bacterium]
MEKEFNQGIKETRLNCGHPFMEIQRDPSWSIEGVQKCRFCGKVIYFENTEDDRATI